MSKNTKDFVEEGDDCGELDCRGHMILPPTINCSCHIHPPCGACMSTQLECNECGWQDPDWEHP